MSRVNNCKKCQANLWKWNKHARAYECKNCGHFDRETQERGVHPANQRCRGRVIGKLRNRMKNRLARIQRAINRAHARSR